MLRIDDGLHGNLLPDNNSCINNCKSDTVPPEEYIILTYEWGCP